MARVVEGVPRKEKRVRCREGCGAMVAYVPNDVREINRTDYGGGPDGCRYVKCPGCGKRIVLESW